MIIIIDYGVGNLNSIKNMIKKVGFKAEITSNIDQISKGTKFVLPGVGSFEYGINKLRSMSYFSVLEKKILEEKTPVLGVCLGAQLLFEASEEGSPVDGLGWIKGSIKKFKHSDKNYNLKIPHMGWNYVKPLKYSKLLEGLDEKSRFYFVHSYHFECKEKEANLLETSYGYPFVSGVEKENVLGVQFHPEKSHKFGMQLYSNYLKNY
ncbi:imidazole glycerol phosphate synthase subunit HisH [Seonamhaeicola sp.]|uniref:imidazole glycerol phosphate synthase subunit HisH n=1 Tax=Seonamhaeicola sp. TaxID=1912245 RepID=UPI00263767D1|nr:imidazole glycerol phosphate synthase subunit HisH [Seonamhaeicola sp.]